MINPSLFLRRAIQADAVVSGAMALLLIAGAGMLAPFLNLPEAFLRNTGFVLVVYAALVGLLGTRGMMLKAAVWAVIAVNAMWTADSIVLLMSGWLSPNLLGQAFIVMQAIAVGTLRSFSSSAYARALRLSQSAENPTQNKIAFVTPNHERDECQAMERRKRLAAISARRRFLVPKPLLKSERRTGWFARPSSWSACRCRAHARWRRSTSQLSS